MNRHLIFLMIRKNLEAIIWMAALASLLFLDPTAPHFSLCLFSHLGLDSCPGCGLGRSIAYFFQGDIAQSFNSHPLGMAAVFILAYRIVVVIKNSIPTIHQNTNP